MHLPFKQHEKGSSFLTHRCWNCPQLVKTFTTVALTWLLGKVSQHESLDWMNYNAKLFFRVCLNNFCQSATLYIFFLWQMAPFTSLQKNVNFQHKKTETVQISASMKHQNQRILISAVCFRRNKTLCVSRIQMLEMNRTLCYGPDFVAVLFELCWCKQTPHSQ